MVAIFLVVIGGSSGYYILVRRPAEIYGLSVHDGHFAYQCRLR